MPTTIQLTPEADYDFNVDIEDQTVKFHVYWNQIDNAWYADIEGLTFDLELLGRKLVGGVDVLKPHAVLELGALYILDSEGENWDPDYDLIGDRYILVYVEKDELDDFTIQ